MKTISLITVAALVATAAGLAGAAALPTGTEVRIEGIGIEAGWHTGRTTLTRAGCTMVRLDHATKHGYTLVALTSTARLERRDGGTWVALPVAALRAQEPKPCLADAAD